MIWPELLVKPLSLKIVLPICTVPVPASDRVSVQGAVDDLHARGARAPVVKNFVARVKRDVTAQRAERKLAGITNSRNLGSPNGI